MFMEEVFKSDSDSERLNAASEKKAAKCGIFGGLSRVTPF